MDLLTGNRLSRRVEEKRHARMPGQAEFDGDAWVYEAVCGRLVELIEIALHPRGVNCRECLSDLGLSREQTLPFTRTVQLPSQAPYFPYPP